MGLATRERLFGGKIPEVGMIREDLSQVEIPLKVMTEVAERVNDGQQLFIVNFVVSLRRLEGLGIVCHGVGSSQSIFLFKDSASSVIAGVSDKRKSFIIVRKHEDRSSVAAAQAD